MRFLFLSRSFCTVLPFRNSEASAQTARRMTEKMSCRMRRMMRASLLTSIAARVVVRLFWWWC